MQTRKIKSPWVILAGPKSMTNVQERPREKGRQSSMDQGRDWRDALLSHGVSARVCVWSRSVLPVSLSALLTRTLVMLD